MKTHAIMFFYAVVIVLGTFTLAQAQEYPLLDKIAQKVIQKYQTSTCQQIAADKAAPKPPMEKRAVDMLKQDPKMRQEFLNKVAAPIATKLFECGMIP